MWERRFMVTFFSVMIFLWVAAVMFFLSGPELFEIINFLKMRPTP